MLSCPTRGRWIEMALDPVVVQFVLASCPTRGRWIEIDRRESMYIVSRVLPHTGQVD